MLQNNWLNCVMSPWREYSATMVTISPTCSAMYSSSLKQGKFDCFLGAIWMIKIIRDFFVFNIAFLILQKRVETLHRFWGDTQRGSVCLGGEGESVSLKRTLINWLVTQQLHPFARRHNADLKRMVYGKASAERVQSRGESDCVRLRNNQNRQRRRDDSIAFATMKQQGQYKAEQTGEITWLVD